MIEENEENFDDEEYPRVKRRIDFFENLLEESTVNFKLDYFLEWKCKSPILFFESKQ